MTPIQAKIIKDSLSYTGQSRLTTCILTYPKFIHSEFMTHRAFSRNAASSRAIPTPKLLDMIESDPSLPEFWGSNQKGMQAATELDGDSLEYCKRKWNEMKKVCISGAYSLNNAGLHKQIANRCIEPWMPITVICTGNERAYQNFFALRAHEAAQPEFQVLAYRLLNEYIQSNPDMLDSQGWHIPFSGVENRYSDNQGLEWDQLNIKDRIKIATARCARISYLTFDGVYSIESDLRLHDQLRDSGHWSPFEHCAQSETRGVASNFGPYWIQYRKLFPNELRTLSENQMQEIYNNRPQWIKDKDNE